jgi:SNF2 family DNA or RNA helicase
MGLNLLSYQVEPAQKLLAILRKRGCAIDASDMGIGKTYVAAWVAAQAGLPVVVVCPKAVVLSWREVLGQAGINYARVINWERLNPNAKAHAEFGYWAKPPRARTEHWYWRLPSRTLIIFDEAHRAGGLKTRASFVMRSKTGGHPALMLSATLAKSPINMLAVCARTGICAPHEHYNWCRGQGCVKNNFSNALIFPHGKNHRPGTKIARASETAQKKLVKLHQKLYCGDEPYGIRVRKTLIPEFPSNNIIPQLVPVYLYSATGDIKNAIDAVKPDDAISELELLIKRRQVAELQKIPFLLQEIPNLVDQGQSVVVFNNYKTTLDILTEMLSDKFNVSIIRGNQTDEVRELNINNFQNDKAHVCLVQTQAGGVGLSLHQQSAGHRPRVSLVAPTFNAVDLVQALGRIHRAGAKSHVNQYILFADDSVESAVYQNVKAKIADIETLNDGDLRVEFDNKTEEL